MHNCPICEQICDCDDEDLLMSAPDDCECGLSCASAEMEADEEAWQSGAVPDEFDDDETCDFTEEDLCT